MNALKQNRTSKRQIAPTSHVRLKTKSDRPRRAPMQAEDAVIGGEIPEANSELVPIPPVTTVVVKVDVGFGNVLFIRGEGDGLSWEKGSPLACVGPSVWVWSTEHVSENLVFKLLINDELWSKGDDLVVPAGGSIEVAPAF